MERYEKVLMSFLTFAICLFVVVTKFLSNNLSVYDRTPYYLLSTLALLIFVLIDRCDFLPFGIIPMALFRLYIMIINFPFDPAAWPPNYIPIIIMGRISSILILIGSVLFIVSYFKKSIVKMVYVPFAISLLLCIISMVLQSEFYIEFIPPLVCFIGYIACL